MSLLLSLRLRLRQPPQLWHRPPGLLLRLRHLQALKSESIHQVRRCPRGKERRRKPLLRSLLRLALRSLALLRSPSLLGLALRSPSLLGLPPLRQLP